MATEVYTGDQIEIISAPETTYGTEGTWDRILRFRSAVPEFNFQQETDAGQFNGVVGQLEVLEANVRESGKLTLTGNLNAEHAFLWLRFWGNATESTLETGVYQQILDHVVYDDYDINSSISFQKNEIASVPAMLGSKCSSIEISGNADNNLIDAVYEFWGQKPDNTDAGGFDKSAIAYLTTKDFWWKDTTIAIGNDSLNNKVTAFSVKMTNGIIPEFASNASKYAVESQPKTLSITGEFTCWYDSTYLRGLQEAGTLIDITFTFENDDNLIGSTKYPKLTLPIYKARITEWPTADQNAGKRSMMTFKWEAFADADNSNKMAIATFQNTDAAFTFHSS